MSSYLLDTSALVEFFNGTELGSFVCDLVEHESVATPMLAIAELSDKAAREGRRCDQEIEFLKQNTTILGFSIDVCREAGQIKQDQRSKQPSFGIADAIMYLTAREHELILVTKDQDFADLDGVRLL